MCTVTLQEERLFGVPKHLIMLQITNFPVYKTILWNASLMRDTCKVWCGYCYENLFCLFFYAKQYSFSFQMR